MANKTESVKKKINNKTNKKPSNKKSVKTNKIVKKINIKLTVVLLSIIGILLIASTYAWFSVNLNVKIKTFNMIVAKNGDLLISLDGINYDTFVELSSEKLLNELKLTYPNNTSQWAANGLTPVSTNGIKNSNSDKFSIYATNGVTYSIRDRHRENGYLKIALSNEDVRREFNSYISFDLFFKNATGSPISDSLYFSETTEFVLEEGANEEMQGLFNSLRVGILKIGTVPTNTDPTIVQNLKCNNNCESVIYEPFSRNHTALSIERALKYSVNLVDGYAFPTYGCINAGGPIFVKNAVSGSPYLDSNYFQLQRTITDDYFNNPLFELPDGVTKVRIYLWIEGQDIDSLETDSSGANISINMGFNKDTQAYSEY